MSNDLYIMHYGVGHDKGGHSGRYPWGSGDQPYGETHGEKDALKEYKKEKRGNIAKDIVGLAVAGPYPGMIMSQVFHKNNSAVSKMDRAYRDLKAQNEIGILSDDLYSSGKSLSYLESGLTNTEKFLNDPKNKKLKNAVVKISNQRKKAYAEGEKLLKDVCGEYDISTLYKSNDKGLADAKNFIDKIVNKSPVDTSLSGVYKDVIKDFKVMYD